MTVIERMEIYNSNDRVRQYVIKFMNKHGLKDVQNAVKCMAVKSYIDYVIGEEKDKQCAG